jgi:hypothetical protein
MVIGHAHCRRHAQQGDGEQQYANGIPGLHLVIPYTT